MVYLYPYFPKALFRERDVWIGYSEIFMKFMSSRYALRFQVTVPDELMEESNIVEEPAQGRKKKFFQWIFERLLLSLAQKPWYNVNTIIGNDGDLLDTWFAGIPFASLKSWLGSKKDGGNNLGSHQNHSIVGAGGPLLLRCPTLRQSILMENHTVSKKCSCRRFCADLKVK